MPKLMTNDDMQTGNIPGLHGFQYSAVKTTRLTAASYTLVTVAMDRSTSVTPFRDLLLDSIKKAIGACAKSPLAANIMVRVITFADDVQEVHGFKPLAEIDVATDYERIQIHGNTALFDACASAIGATADYGKVLADQDYGVSGILFVITDGADNRSKYTPGVVRQQTDAILQQETLETFTSVLVGINAAQYRTYLDRFKQDGGITQFVDAGDATPGNLAKLAAFVSKSVSSTAQGIAPVGISI